MHAAWPIIYAVLKRQEIKQLSFNKKRQERWIKDKKLLCYCGRNSNAHQMFHLSYVSFGSSSMSQPLYGLWTYVTSSGQWNGSQRDVQSEGISSLCINFQPLFFSFFLSFFFFQFLSLFFSNWGSYVFHMECLQFGRVLVSLGPWMEQRYLLTCDGHVGWARNASLLY